MVKISRCRIIKLKNNNMENLEPQREEKNIGVDLDEVARKYAEGLRMEIKELKDRELDLHLKNINPEELTYDDLMIFDKAKKYKLTERDFREYSERLREYFKEQKKIREGHFDVIKDTRSNFSAMIRNMMIAEENVLRRQ